jgi:hypothetical protein
MAWKPERLLKGKRYSAAAGYQMRVELRVRNLPCPTCLVQAGEPCEYPWALPTHIWASHIRRYEAAVVARLVIPRGAVDFSPREG